MVRLSRNKQDFLDAANKKPANRSPEEQGLVDDAKRVGMTDVKNADEAAKKSQRIYGTKK